MRVRMLCLGRHWNPLEYRYEATRADYDGAPVAEGADEPEVWAIAVQLSAAAQASASIVSLRSMVFSPVMV